VGARGLVLGEEKLDQTISIELTRHGMIDGDRAVGERKDGLLVSQEHS
jgi:hypothetical protein